MKYIINIFDLHRNNFKQSLIPTGYGFIIWLTAVPSYLLIAIINNIDIDYICLFAICVFGLIGLIDDIYGSRSTGGFRGHFTLLMRGEITTGAIKAIVGGIISIILGFAIANFNIFTGIINSFIIALSANMLNLLDLRPGRSLACFWLGLIILIVSFSEINFLSGFLPVIIPALLLTYLDREAYVMIGDAGSNILGAILGVGFSIALGLTFKLVLVIVLIGIHLYSEKHSISKLIESSRILNRIDRLLGVR